MWCRLPCSAWWQTQNIQWPYVCIYRGSCGGALGQNEVATSIMRAEVCVCVFHYDCPLYNGPSGPYCFRLVLRPPVAADVILRSSNSSLIIVYNVCICVFFSLPVHFLSVCVHVLVHTYLFLSAWVSIFACSATCVYSLIMFSPEEHECEAVSEVPGVCWGWDRVDMVTAWGWGGGLLLVLFLWHQQSLLSDSDTHTHTHSYICLRHGPAPLIHIFYDKCANLDLLSNGCDIWSHSGRFCKHTSLWKIQTHTCCLHFAFSKVMNRQKKFTVLSPTLVYSCFVDYLRMFLSSSQVGGSCWCSPTTGLMTFDQAVQVEFWRRSTCCLAGLVAQLGSNTDCFIPTYYAFNYW